MKFNVPDKIVRLVANWWYNTELGEDYEIFIVGRDGVTQILEHRPQGEGDKWFYDVYFEKEGTRRIFNPNSVSYAPSLE